MQDIIFYTRDESGLLTRHVSGVWESESQFAEYCGLGEFEPEVERLTGWPDQTVTWYGAIGIASR